MKKSVTIKTQVEVPCSMCVTGQNFLEDDSPDCEIHFNFGYGSEHDGAHGVTHFCSKCAEKVFNVLTQHFPEVQFTPFDS